MELERKYIYDPLLRLNHALIGLSCLVLLTTAYSAEFFYENGLIRKSFWIVHVYAGFVLSFAVILRIIWGIIGPYQARCPRLIHIKTWKNWIRNRKINFFDWDYGHNPLASIAYLSLYIILAILSVTGIFLAAIEHNLGPLAQSWYDNLTYKHDLKEVHESLSALVIVFIFVHILALYLHEKIENLPIVQSMFSGYQYKHKKAEDQSHE